MPTPAIKYDGHAVDLSGRVFSTSSVTASPAAAAETIIGTLTIGEDVAAQKAAYLFGWFSFTAGTNGVSAVARIRKTDVSGSVLTASGAITVVAASLYERSVLAIDTGPTLPGQVYVVTLTVASASAASTVSALNLIGLVV